MARVIPLTLGDGLADLLRQARSCKPLLLALYLPPSLLFGLIVFLKLEYGIAARIFLYDPAQILSNHDVSEELLPFVGVVSSIGLLFWAATAAVCFFARVVIRSIGHKDALVEGYFIYAGLFSTLLLADDLLMLHEKLFHWVTHLPDVVLQAVYGILLAAFMVRFRTLILRTDYLLLLLAATFMGLSVIIDAKHFFSGSILLEDMFKFYGILSWFGYFARTAYQEVLG